MARTILAAAAAVLALLTVGGCSSAGTGSLRASVSGSVSMSAPVPRPASAAASAASATASAPRPPSSAAVPRPKHTVVVVMENHSFDDVIGNRSAPFINALADSGALFTHSFAITHPSEPNYLALFSGSTQGLTDDPCPHSYPGPSLGEEVRDGGSTFVGYSEGLPRPGFTGCTRGAYARRHVPWADFRALPASVNQPFTSFPSSYSRLPKLAFVIPDLDHDMHDGTVAEGDRWLRTNLGAYARWARSHDSLLVITWDEDDRSEDNRIPTIITGAGVAPGRYSEHLTHYRLLRTLTACLGVPAIGASSKDAPVTDIWRR